MVEARLILRRCAFFWPDGLCRHCVDAMKVILNSVPYERKNLGLDYVPDPEIVISGARELEIMGAQMLREGKFTG